MLGVVGFVVLAMATKLPWIILGIVVSAISGGTALAVLTAQIGDLTPKGQEGMVMGAYATAGDVGSTLGPILAFGLAQAAGLRTAYLFSALVFVGGLTLTFPGRQLERRPGSDARSA